MSGWRWEQGTCECDSSCACQGERVNVVRYALAADIQTIPGLPTAPGYLNVDVDPETGEIDGLF